MRKITTANESERLNLPRNRARQGDASCWSHQWTRRVGAEGALVASQPRRRACPGGLRMAQPAMATSPAARSCPGGQQASRPDPEQPYPGVGWADLPAPVASPADVLCPAQLPRRPALGGAASPEGSALHGSHSSPTSTARNHGGLEDWSWGGVRRGAGEKWGRQ